MDGLLGIDSMESENDSCEFVMDCEGLIPENLRMILASLRFLVESTYIVAKSLLFGI